MSDLNKIVLSAIFQLFFNGYAISKQPKIDFLVLSKCNQLIVLKTEPFVR